MQSARKGRNNYYKYEDIKKRMEAELEIEQPAKVIASKLNIAVATFHKYKNFLQIEKNKQFITEDEHFFLKQIKQKKDEKPCPKSKK